MILIRKIEASSKYSPISRRTYLLRIKRGKFVRAIMRNTDKFTLRIPDLAIFHHPICRLVHHPLSGIKVSGLDSFHILRIHFRGYSTETDVIVHREHTGIVGS